MRKVSCGGESAHSGSSLRLGTSARIFLNLFQNLTSVILSVVGDMPVDSEAPIYFVNVEDLPAQSLGGAYRGMVACVY